MEQTPNPRPVRKPRCLFNDSELTVIITNDKLCELLKIAQKPRNILALHIMQGFTFYFARESRLPVWQADSRVSYFISSAYEGFLNLYSSLLLGVNLLKLLTISSGI